EIGGRAEDAAPAVRSDQRSVLDAELHVAARRPAEGRLPVEEEDPARRNLLRRQAVRPVTVTLRPHRGPSESGAYQETHGAEPAHCPYPFLAAAASPRLFATGRRDSLPESHAAFERGGTEGSLKYPLPLQ